MTGKALDLPVIDFNDQPWIFTLLQLETPSGPTDLIVDEGHNQNPCERLVACTVSRDHRLLAVTNVPQCIFQFRGVELGYLLSTLPGPGNAAYLELQQCWRCPKAVLRRAQEILTNGLGLSLTIIGMKDLEGEVIEHATLHSHPFDLSRTIIVTCRVVSSGFLFYIILLSKGYPVQMHGQPETASALERLLNRFDGALPTVLVAVQRASQAAVASERTNEADMLSALAYALQEFLRQNPDYQGNARQPFIDYLYDLFKSRSIVPGIIFIMSIHAAQGLGAQDVYHFQPELCPLQDRIAEGGFKENEEWCICYVNETRTEERTIKLQHLPVVSREGILNLFKPLPTSVPAEEDVPKPEPEAPVEDDDEDRVEEQINNALIILGLSALPSTVAEANAAARTVLKASHPDHNFNSSASVERTQKILDARTLLRKHLGSAA